MSSPSAFNPSSTITFVVKNNSSIGRSIKVFNTRIVPGGTLDLMKIPGVSEEDIKTEITKGSLNALFSGGSLTVVSSTVNFSTVDSKFGAFLRKLGLTGTLDNTQAQSQSNWYIDPVNGSDTNSGDVLSSPIKTWVEFNRRIGRGSLLPGTLSTAIQPIHLTVVNLLNNGNPADPIDFDIVMPMSSLLAIVGQATTVGSGTISAVTAKNRATNQADEITDGYQTWASHIGKRIRNTTVGPNLGQIAWVAKDLGAGVARISPPNNPSTPPPPDRLFQTTVTPGVFSPGDTYVIEDMTQVYIGSTTIRSQNTGGSFNPIIGFYNCDFRRATTPVQAQIGIISADAVYKGCRFNTLIQFAGIVSRLHNLVNCCFAGGAIMSPGPTSIIRGGLSLGNVGAITEVVFNFDHMVQGGNVSALDYGQLSISSLAVFDSPTSGVSVRRARVYIDNFFGAVSQALWGSGNASYGIDVLGGGRLVYASTLPTITGNLGDFQLAGSTTSTTYNPATGTFINPEVSNTWANLALSIGSGGLDGNAHNVAKNARIVKLS